MNRFAEQYPDEGDSGTGAVDSQRDFRAGGFDDPSRKDPEKTGEVRNDLLAAAEKGQRMSTLVRELRELSSELPADLVMRLNNIKSHIFGLERAIEESFSNWVERADNPTYLSNVAAARHFDAEDKAERQRKAERHRAERQTT